MFNILSGLCYLFAIADYALFQFFDIDLTGFAFSPLLAGCAGAFFGRLGKPKGEEEVSDEACD